jgi:DNA topoisomerase I
MTLRDTKTEGEVLAPTVEAAKQVAAEAGLRYVSDRKPGFSRRKAGQGFVYLDENGKKLSDKTHLERIKNLVIPPAWTEVWICSTANGHLQVTGRDAKKRKQYKYHEKWNATRNSNKFDKLISFCRVLPKVRSRVRRDLRRPNYDREKILAAIISIMERTLIRVGNEEYAQTNNSYGLTTIKNKHVKVKAKEVHFKFRGKSGVEHEIVLADVRLAKIIRDCQDLPGQDLFSYQCEDGKYVDVTSADVNDYLREITGQEITAKDFRTWGGTLLAIRSLCSMEKPHNKTQFKKCVTAALKQTAERLGNTPTICRGYYVHPAVFELFESGELHKVAKQKAGHGLTSDDLLVRTLLKKAATTKKSTKD